jgi:hypothetical protein
MYSRRARRGKKGAFSSEKTASETGKEELWLLLILKIRQK